MLVLARKTSERIVIGGNIVITIVKIDGNKVRIGIEAPEDVSIIRAELLDEVRLAVESEELEAVAC